MKVLISYTSTPYYFPFFIVVHYHNGNVVRIYMTPSSIDCVISHGTSLMKFYAL